MDNDKLNTLILEQLHDLMQHQADLKASVDSHIEKVQDLKLIITKHEDTINHHSVLFKAIFWVATTLGGLVATWAARYHA